MTPAPSAADIQHHLYTSFLQGSTADVALRVHGSWDAVYNLHRVVLIQSGFFRSLFTAGFIESSPRSNNLDGPHEIVVHFDDQNITRAAFETCISRLYGGGPPLHVSPNLIPTTAEPLTPSFPSQGPFFKTPDNHHPATPRFLLSLLATAVYLSIPSIASQALSSILSTVGPRTVVTYLNFALGKHIGSLHLEIGEPEAAVGLEHVAQMVADDEKSLLGGSIISLQSTKDTSNLSPSISSDSNSDDDGDFVEEPSFHYGAISDKIGEACACWLARWGTDILAYELQDGKAKETDSGVAAVTRKRAKTIPSDPAPATVSPIKVLVERPSVPLIWSIGGLSAKWVTAIISSDTFFVKGERERYIFARSVVELRRKDGIIEAEEKEWAKLFEHGIYYANMTTEEIINISQDISPTTKRPVVSLEILQAAHWTQSVLRHHITSRPSPIAPSLSTPSVASAPRDKELGITLTTADMFARASDAGTENSKPYFPVPVDSSHRIGDNGSNFQPSEGPSLSMDQLFTSTSSSNLSPSPPSPTIIKPNSGTSSKPPTSESDFFGLLPPRYTPASCIIADPTGKSRWSSYPPYRFAIEFWDLDSLKEKSRLHSHTIWYAGSLFNTYVQVVRKKGQVQLGIYLHRQSSIEPIPSPSAPSSLLLNRSERTSGPSAGNVSAAHGRGPSLPSPSIPSSTNHYSPSIHPSSRSTTPISYSNSQNSPSLPSSPSSFSVAGSSSNTLPATASPTTPPQPYRDPRPSISAYFTISCASATGSSQTRFTSSPDVFSVSQSWGWKSSSLRTEEYMDIRGDGAGSGDGAVPRKEVSLRATVVLGLV